MEAYRRRRAGRSLVMGILNVTPDSFSDGGLYVNADAAVERAYRMVRQGADIVDVGGESTRPGATPLSARDEWDRIGSVVRTLANTPIRVSVDTYHAETARRAADAGAAIVNDVTGGHGDPSMLSAIAATGCTYILQHNRGGGASTDALASYGDVARRSPANCPLRSTGRSPRASTPPRSSSTPASASPRSARRTGTWPPTWSPS